MSFPSVLKRITKNPFRNVGVYHLALWLPVALVGIGGAQESWFAASRPATKKAPVKKAPVKKAPAASKAPAKAVPVAAAAHPVAPGNFPAVKKLLDARCAPCHGNGVKLGEFSIDTQASLIQGGTVHPAVVPGDSAKSYLIKLVSGEIPGKIMPPQGPRLTPAEINLLKQWIDAGVPFGETKIVPKWKPQFAPRKPTLPKPAPGSVSSNPIDLLLNPYFQANKVQPKALVDDRTYARRVYLDLVGMLPTPEELHTFQKDPRKDKRERLAQQLLSDKKRYAEHWLSFWNDMLRNDYAGTGYIDGGRKQITDWLYASLYENKPYDKFVWELVNPTPESEGFIKGIVWRGVVNASQTPQMQAAQNISQVFMGINMKCASCHNSFINDWKLEDAYGLAAIFAEQELELVRCDVPTGQIAQIKFLYPELGTIDPKASRTERVRQLADTITKKENGRFSRTIVNRIWTKLMGRGLIEPNDEMDNPPWDVDLLDWLASDFADNGYDVKRLMTQIVTSRAYQLPSAPISTEKGSEYVFRGPAVKRLSAEQFVDALSSLTGVWQKPARPFRMVNGKPILPAGSSAAVKFSSGVMKSGRAEIDVDVTGAEVLSLIVTNAGDGSGHDWADWAEPRLVGPGGETRLTDLKWRSGTTGYGTIQMNKNIVEKPLRLGDATYAEGIGTHAGSVITYILPKGVTRFKAVAGPDAQGVEESQGKTSIEMFVVTGDRSLLETRAALAVADPLMVALDRPNREVTVTQRSTVATTLQTLELTNGNTLASMLATGAERWMEEPGTSSSGLIKALYERALGRLPTPAEQKLALEVVGSPAKKEGVEDLLWALVMLPEFQLIH